MMAQSTMVETKTLLNLTKVVGIPDAMEVHSQAQLRKIGVLIQSAFMRDTPHAKHSRPQASECQNAL